ncbi:hypothetical protein AcW1_007025 [Taiwanofungus camphoratus]|nr:hypothetical protein AcV7_005170 [Antrodia cinnamomea]KAI0955440.1 hypothetical protein AcW1_007025 [Antrodia cinnamomea]
MHSVDAGSERCKGVEKLRKYWELGTTLLVWSVEHITRGCPVPLLDHRRHDRRRWMPSQLRKLLKNEEWRRKHCSRKTQQAPASQPDGTAVARRRPITAHEKEHLARLELSKREGD